MPKPIDVYQELINIADDLRRRYERGELTDWREIAEFLATIDRFSDQLPPQVQIRVTSGLAEALESLRRDTREKLKSLSRRAFEIVRLYSRDVLDYDEARKELENLLKERDELAEGSLYGIKREYEEVEKSVKQALEDLDRARREKESLVLELEKLSRTIKESFEGMDDNTAILVASLVSLNKSIRDLMKVLEERKAS